MFYDLCQQILGNFCKSGAGRVNFPTFTRNSANKFEYDFWFFFRNCLIGKYLQILQNLCGKKDTLDQNFAVNIYTKVREEKTLFDGLKNCFSELLVYCGEIWRKRVIIQSQANIDFVFILQPLSFFACCFSSWKISIIECY